MIGTLFNLGDTIEFEVYPTALFGYSFKNRKVVAVIDHRTAVLYGLDVEATHAAVFPTLPENSTPDDHRKYNYLLLETQAGDREVIGIPWIREETVARVTSQVITVMIQASAAATLENVRAAMVANGFQVLGIDVTGAPSDAV